MCTHTHHHERTQLPTLVYAARTGTHRHQWRWLAAGLALAFSIPSVLTDLTSINRDLYYGAFIAGAALTLLYCLAESEVTP